MTNKLAGIEIYEPKSDGGPLPCAAEEIIAGYHSILAQATRILSDKEQIIDKNALAYAMIWGQIDNAIYYQMFVRWAHEFGHNGTVDSPNTVERALKMLNDVDDTLRRIDLFLLGDSIDGPYCDAIHAPWNDGGGTSGSMINFTSHNLHLGRIKATVLRDLRRIIIATSDNLSHHIARLRQAD